MSYNIALEIKEYLVNLAVEDKLPMDMNQLDELAIQQIIEKGTPKTAFGFGLIDVEHCVKSVNEYRAEHTDKDQIEYTDEFGEEVLDYIDRKADASIGVNWDTIEYYIDSEMGV